MYMSPFNSYVERNNLLILKVVNTIRARETIMERIDKRRANVCAMTLSLDCWAYPMDANASNVVGKGNAHHAILNFFKDFWNNLGLLTCESH